MNRVLIPALSGLVATALAGCDQKEALKAAPPGVYVDEWDRLVIRKSPRAGLLKAPPAGTSR